MGMLVLDSFKGHLTPEIKATAIRSTMHSCFGCTWGEYHTTAGARCDEQTIHRPPKAAV
jgi:hypothetical protein